MKKLLCLVLASMILFVSCGKAPIQTPDELPDVTSHDITEEVLTEEVTTVTATEAVTTTTEEPHECENKCDECELCLNGACEEDACKNKCQGHHKCLNVCDVCKLCMDAKCDEDVCNDKCSGHKEDPYEFADNDVITSKDTTITVGEITYNIDKNVYVPEHIYRVTEVFTELMESVTGHKFDGNGYACDFYPDGKSHVTVTRDNLYIDYDWYAGLKTSEFGAAYASASDHACVSPGDIVSGYTVIHELGHVLMFRQAGWSYSTLLNEGYTEYTSHLVLKEIEESYPELILYIDEPEYLHFNLSIYDFSKLYEQPIEYWFDNTFEYASNGSYAIGFAFMKYLDDVYGSYTKWVNKYEETYPFSKADTNSDPAETDKQIEVLKKAYGDDVMDNFYPWLKQHEEDFMPECEKAVDLTSVDAINLYPIFNAAEQTAYIEFTTARPIEYEDLYINLGTLRSYLEEYKSTDASKLVLKISNRHNPADTYTVNLYKQDGSFVTVSVTDSIALDKDISYIKLVGSGTFSRLEVTHLEE